MRQKFIYFFIFLLLSFCLNAQVVMTQTFIDKCSGELKIATTTYVNGNAVVLFYNQMRSFTPAQVQSGELQIWLQQTYLMYNAMGCPTSIVVQQTVQQTVNQAVQQAASAASTQAANTAASSAASSATKTAIPTPVSPSPTPTTSTPPPATNNSSSPPPPPAENKSSSSPAPTENKSSSETKSESKSESKSEEKKEESKSESKKEDKKKTNETNPLLFGSDLSLVESPDRTFNAIISLGLSKSSLMGNESYSVNSMIWSNLQQFAVSGGYTKMDFDMGKLKAIHSYSVTTAYLTGNFMGLVGYTFIKPHPKYGTYGYNLGLVNLFIKDTETSGDVTKKVFNPLISSSLVTFWTKPYQVSKKLTLSPQIFVMSSPLGYNPSTGKNNVSRDLGFLVGSSFDYKISKRFGFSLNYKVATSTTEGAPFLSNILIGSRLML